MILLGVLGGPPSLEGTLPIDANTYVPHKKVLPIYSNSSTLEVSNLRSNILIEMRLNAQKIGFYMTQSPRLDLGYVGTV